MKKIFALATLALAAVAMVACVGNTTQEKHDEMAETDIAAEAIKDAGDAIAKAIEATGNIFDENLEQSAKELGVSANKAFKEIEKNLDHIANDKNLEQALESFGEKVESAMEKVGKNLEKRLEDENFEKSMEEAGDKIEKAAEEAGKKIGKVLNAFESLL